MADVLDALVATLEARDADRVRETFEWIAPHCDLEERLPRVPPSARIRGLWSKVLEDQLAERGLLREYRRLVPMPRAFAFKWQPLGEFLVRAAVAGALVRGAERLHDGMYELTLDNARRFTSSLLGGALFQILARDPHRLRQQVLASKRLACSYGAWEFQSLTDREARVHMREEYIWIESYLLGAAVGTFEVLGDDVRGVAELEGPFHGTQVIRWAPR